MNRNKIDEYLYERYGIEIASVVQIEGGWSASAYVLTDNKNDRFLLKQYDKSRPSTIKLTSGIDDYMPLVSWLNRNTELGRKIVNPLPADTGSYKCEDDHHVYVLSEYIEGSNLVGKSFTDRHIVQLADILALLHSYGEDIPLPVANIKEDFRIYFQEPLLNIISPFAHLDKDIHRIVSPHTDEIVKGLEQLTAISAELRTMPLKYVLCHTDLHEGNLIEGREGLWLIDWEGLKLAPREADLFTLTHRQWFGKFLDRYGKESRIDRDVLHFYHLRRVLEDIWEFVEQLHFDNLTGDERSSSLNYLVRECEKLALLLK